MIPLLDHVLLGTSFFLIGGVLGLYLGYGLIPANKNRRL